LEAEDVIAVAGLHLVEELISANNESAKLNEET